MKLSGRTRIMSDITIDEDLLERMLRAVERVRERLLRAAKALEDAGIPYAVVGGNAVAAWVARVDESAVRNTQDVDIVLRRADLEAAKRAMAGSGFFLPAPRRCRHVPGWTRRPGQGRGPCRFCRGEDSSGLRDAGS